MPTIQLDLDAGCESDRISARTRESGIDAARLGNEARQATHFYCTHALASKLIGPIHLT